MATAKKIPRHQERVFAFKALYSLCFSPVASLEELEAALTSLPDRQQAEQEATVFAWELLRGTWQHQTQIDETIAGFSQNWRLDRMAKVELTLLRLALFELMFRPDIPVRAAVNEAVELSKEFGDDKSRGFVNGILDAALKAIEAGTLAHRAV